jgi:hypothetical protein
MSASAGTAMDTKLTLVRPEPSYRDSIRPSVFQDGLEFQDFVCTELAKAGLILQNLASRKYQYEVGENLQGFEIKLDQRCTETKRLSIEVAEKTRNDPSLPWTDSGIMRGDNSWLYIQGNREKIFVFNKKFLVAYYMQRIGPDGVDEKYGTIKTFYLPLDVAMAKAAKVFTFSNAR